LIAVTAVGLTLTIVTTPGRRRARFAAIRDYHGSRFASMVVSTERGLTVMNAQGMVLYRYDTPNPSKQQMRFQDAEQSWHATMFQKYENAYQHPWLPVPPDPPEPKSTKSLAHRPAPQIR
jgi:hypothetical protein